MALDLSKLERFTVNLKDLYSYTNIKSIFREKKIDRYMYIIKHKSSVIKIGISYKIQEPADRIYTQIGHMPGWEQPLLKRSRKTGEATQAMIDKLGDDFHKNDVEVEIINCTDAEFFDPTQDKLVYIEMQNAEEALKQEYYDQFGCYPIGNVKQEKVRFIPDKNTFDSLFEW